MRIFTLLVLSYFMLACSEQEAPTPKIPEVFVVAASEQLYHPSRTYNARVQSASDVDIKAEVSGKLVAINFEEGNEVKKGDLLFKLDSKPYDAKLSRAKSDFDTAATDLKIAKKNYERGQKIVKEGHISASDFDKLKARKLKAESQLESAQTTVNSALIEVDYTNIKAPIDGRIGRANPAIGDLLGPDYGVLTTLVGQDGMQVVFHLPERLILRLKNPDTNIQVEDIIVSIKMEDGTEYAHTSQLDYFSNRVDSATGTIEARVDIANPDYLLRPGMFVRAILRLEEPVQSLVVPQAAVQVDQLGSYVFVADSNNKVVRKDIETDDRIGENVVVVLGLESGDRVIARGVQQARPGDTVKVFDYVPTTSAGGEEVQ